MNPAGNPLQFITYMLDGVKWRPEKDTPEVIIFHSPVHYSKSEGRHQDSQSQNNEVTSPAETSAVRVSREECKSRCPRQTGMCWLIGRSMAAFGRQS